MFLYFLPGYSSVFCFLYFLPGLIHKTLFKRRRTSVASQHSLEPQTSVVSQLNLSLFLCDQSNFYDPVKSPRLLTVSGFLNRLRCTPCSLAIYISLASSLFLKLSFTGSFTLPGRIFIPEKLSSLPRSSPKLLHTPWSYLHC